MCHLMRQFPVIIAVSKANMFWICESPEEKFVDIESACFISVRKW